MEPDFNHLDPASMNRIQHKLDQLAEYGVNFDTGSALFTRMETLINLLEINGTIDRERFEKLWQATVEQMADDAIVLLEAREVLAQDDLNADTLLNLNGGLFNDDNRE